MRFRHGFKHAFLCRGFNKACVRYLRSLPHRQLRQPILGMRCKNAVHLRIPDSLTFRECTAAPCSVFDARRLKAHYNLGCYGDVRLPIAPSLRVFYLLQRSRVRSRRGQKLAGWDHGALWWSIAVRPSKRNNAFSSAN